MFELAILRRVVKQAVIAAAPLSFPLNGGVKQRMLKETVLGALALRKSGNWSEQEIEMLWSDEALTSAVLPRYHVDQSIKRALGSRLGTLKEKDSSGKAQRSEIEN